MSTMQANTQEKTRRATSNGKSAEADLAGITHDQIARRAYELWQARGCPTGDGSQDWEAARNELLNRCSTANTKTSSQAAPSQAATKLNEPIQPEPDAAGCGDHMPPAAPSTSQLSDVQLASQVHRFDQDHACDARGRGVLLRLWDRLRNAAM